MCVSLSLSVSVSVCLSVFLPLCLSVSLSVSLKEQPKQESTLCLCLCALDSVHGLASLGYRGLQCLVSAADDSLDCLSLPPRPSTLFPSD